MPPQAWFVAQKDHTPADNVRRAMDDAERQIANLRGQGPEAVNSLYLLDEIDDGLAELVGSGMDVRAERSRFETIQRRLYRHRGRFLREVREKLAQERAAVQPSSARWWWFLDKTVAQENTQQLRRWVIRAAVALVVAITLGIVYDRFIAPPPEVREAYRLQSEAESLIMEGELQGALVNFEAAAVHTPDDPSFWTWQGVLQIELGNQDVADEFFEKALPMYEEELDFLTDRSMSYLSVLDFDAATTDAEQVITQYPESGIGYFLRGASYERQGEYGLAIADLEQAASLANASGDVQLEGTARTQMAMLIQYQMGQLPGGQ